MLTIVRVAVSITATSCVMFSATYRRLPFGIERQAARRRPAGDRNRAVGGERAVGGRLEDLHVVAGAAADVDRVSGRTERHADEAVRDADRLLERPGVQVDEMQRARVEVAAGHDGEQAAVRAHHHPERTIVDLDVRAGRRQRLAVRHQDAAIVLHADDDAMSDGQCGCTDPHGHHHYSNEQAGKMSRRHVSSWRGGAKGAQPATSMKRVRDNDATMTQPRRNDAVNFGRVHHAHAPRRLSNGQPHSSDAPGTGRRRAEIRHRRRITRGGLGGSRPELAGIQPAGPGGGPRRANAVARAGQVPRHLLVEPR